MLRQAPGDVGDSIATGRRGPSPAFPRLITPRKTIPFAKPAGGSAGSPANHHFRAARGSAFFAALLPVLLAALLLGLAGCGGSSAAPPPPAISNQAFFITNTCTYSLDSLTHQETQLCQYALPNLVQGVPFSLGLETDAGPVNSSVPIQANSVTPPISFQLGANATLPPGLTFDSSGLIKGIPTQPGTYTVDVVAVDSSRPKPVVSQTATFTMTVLPALALLREVGHSDLGGVGQNADVTVQGDYAFVGTRGTPGSCPNNGVKVVSLADVTNPRLVATIPDVSSTSYAPEAKAQNVTGPVFSGDLLAVAVSPCNPAPGMDNNAGDRGVALYDVSSPASPKFLGFWQSGGEGVGDVAVLPRPDANHPANSKIYLLAAVPNSAATDPGEGDLRVVDVTNPATPVEVANWDVFRALDITNPSLVELGQDQRIFLDSIQLSSDGNTAFLSYWDEGVVVMDVTQPAAVASSNQNIILSHITYPVLIPATPENYSSPEGNTHEALPIADGGLLISDKVCASQKIPNPANPSQTISANPATNIVCGTDVDLSPISGWGYLRTYSMLNLAAPAIAGYSFLYTGESNPPPDNGIYTPNNLAWNGNTQDPRAYVAWFSNGVVDLDLSSLSSPAILGAYVPPATVDPQGSDPTKNNPARPLVYGVAPYSQGANHYVIASDINSGLWVIQESSAPEFAILTTSLPAATINVPYSVQLVAVNGAPGVTWSLSGQPANLSIGLATGLLSGNFNTAGTYTFTVTATNNKGGGGSASQQYSLSVNSNFTIPQSALIEATLNEPYAFNLSAVNGVGAESWKLLSGNLPPGMTFASTGDFTGTPTESGNFPITVEVTDSSNPPLSTTASYVLQVQPFSFLTPSALPAGEVGEALTSGILMANGKAPFSYVLTGGALPPGITLNTTLGTLSGSPTAPGNYSFRVQVTDSLGATATGQFTMSVTQFTLASASLPAGTVNQGYYALIQPLEGVAPFSYTLASGSLPPGLTLSAQGAGNQSGLQTGNTGVITGIPTAAGTFPFTVSVQDSDGNIVSASYSITINP